LIAATLDGKTPAEIAREMGLTPKTISNEKCRIIRKLRALMAEG
jgi:DNA-binding CsgD family transcriptional regulator